MIIEVQRNFPFAFFKVSILFLQISHFYYCFLHLCELCFFIIRMAKSCESLNTVTSFIWWIVGFYWVVSGGDAFLQAAPTLYWYEKNYTNYILFGRWLCWKICTDFTLNKIIRTDIYFIYSPFFLTLILMCGQCL